VGQGAAAADAAAEVPEGGLARVPMAAASGGRVRGTRSARRITADIDAAGSIIGGILIAESARWP